MKNRLNLKYPASWWGSKWRDVLPAGNGTIGAGVYGAVHDETVLLTHEDLWHASRTLPMPDVSHLLPEIRRLLDGGDVREADRLMADTLKDLGYQPRIGFPLPLADLKVKMPVHGGFRNYSRSLDMETGEVSVTWKDRGHTYTRSLFVSRPDNLVAMLVQSDDPAMRLDVTIGLHDLNDKRFTGGDQVPHPSDVEVLADADGTLRYAARNDDETDFGAMVRVIPVASAGDGEALPSVTPDMNRIVVSNASRVLIVAKLFVQGKRLTAWPELARQLGNIVMDYHVLMASHVVEHREWFERVKLDLGGSEADHAASNEELLLQAYQGEAPIALVEKMWSYGRYLLLSSSRPGGQPCPLYGKWCGDYQGMWTFHMANENLQMIYWQALGGQLSEAMLPVFDYYDSKLGDFRENARKLYGCRGIYIPAVSTPESGLHKLISPHILHWTGAAAWISQMYYDYYLHTGDGDFLRNRAFPFLREVALFYEDFFTVDEKGYFKSSPSNSPENTPANYWDGKGMGASMETTINATMDFALAKEALTHLIEAADHLGHDPSEIRKWREMKGKIPPYQLNPDGSVREWMHPFFDDNNHHRHQSHIYPVFPGMEVTEESDPAMYQAFHKAVIKRLDIGISEQTGWSFAHMANIYARLKDGSRALECLNLLARSCLMNNFFTTHNDWRNMGVGVDMTWAPFQIDANMGWSAAVQEMLLVSRPGRITLLPALPSKWAKGSVEGLVARGNIRVAVAWDMEAGCVSAELLAMGQGGTVELDVPLPERRCLRVDLAPGVPQTVVIRREEAGGVAANVRGLDRS